jgi:phenylpropionate dioxygenase-like ring-hydroxylating dioxygenase large terminal subunit
MTNLCAGGPNSDTFEPLEAWYPVHFVEDLDRSKPTAFTLLDQALVIWWDKSKEMWRVYSDRCPHRLASLAEGRINENNELECPYHGWTFAGEGQCTTIPQQPEGKNLHQNNLACVRSYPAQVGQGMLFVYPGEASNAPNADLPLVTPLHDEPEGWVLLQTFRDLPYDASTLLENVLDTSHVPFTHHKSVSDRKYAAPLDLEVVSADKWGFKGRWEEGPRNGTLGSQDTTFVAPNLMWHDLTSKQFGRTMTVVYATPISKGKCRVFAQFPFKFSSKLPAFFIKLAPRWYSHLGQNNIFEDDHVFLHRQERYLEEQGGSDRFNQAFYLPTKADAFIIAYRKWFNQFKAEPFPNQKLTSALDKTAILERYHTHTEHCSSCSNALTNIKRLKLGALIAAFGLGISVYLNYWLMVPSVALLITGLWLGQWEVKFHEGQQLPKRNT